MTFSNEWEHVYQRGEQNSIWPWSDLVGYVMRYARPSGEGFRVLELGFGAGANVSFFLSRGVQYFGTEGSATAVERVRERFAAQPNFHAACCDFTSTIPFEGPFDLAVDRSSLTHNDTASIQRCLALLHDRLPPGAKLIGIDWFSTGNGDFPQGREQGDYYTRGNFASGQFQNVGTVHFFDEAHLSGLLSGAGFSLERLEHKRSEMAVPAGESSMAWWNFVAVRT
ncbi:MAG: class I SAM-dependent methyltransferase [Gammaproteobacteria bacterium]